MRWVGDQDEAAWERQGDVQHRWIQSAIYSGSVGIHPWFYWDLVESAT